MNGDTRVANLGVERSRSSSQEGVLVVQVDRRRHLGQEFDRLGSSPLERFGNQGGVDT